ncbi:MAG: hypothetical protein BWY32_03839 [bacterium ADurb.Bin243]|nr:MAG: hypothetical protein BWY32_03839 [bacterium ADurb.Bin243]
MTTATFPPPRPRSRMPRPDGATSPARSTSSARRPSPGRGSASTSTAPPGATCSSRYWRPSARRWCHSAAPTASCRSTPRRWRRRMRPGSPAGSLRTISTRSCRPTATETGRWSPTTPERCCGATPWGCWPPGCSAPTASRRRSMPTPR